MRLAFAVAAHLEPEILLVDEVLAVGDLEFQKKCLGKMDQVTRTGRTIVFVSHQMNQIRRLCKSCIWIDGGTIKLAGPMLDVVSSYEQSFSSISASAEDSDRRKHSTRFLSWKIAEPHNEKSNVLDSFGNVTFEFTLAVSADIRVGTHGIALFNSDQQIIWATSVENLTLVSGLHALSFRLPSLPLKPGIYHWQMSIWEGGKCLDQWTGVPDLIVGTKPITHAQEQWQGLLNSPWEFQVQHVDQPMPGQDLSSMNRLAGG